MMQELIGKGGVDLNEKEEGTGRTALHVAAAQVGCEGAQ